MKLSDDACDVGDDKSLAIALGLLCAITSAFATVSSASAAYIFIGILIGNLLALKVDGIHHIITLVLFVLISLIMGIPELSVVILLICIFSALLDEVGHELISNLTENKFLNYFFEYRCAMKVAIFLLAVCGVFNIFFFVFRRVKYYKFYRLRSGGGRKYRFFRKQGTDQSGENIAVLEALGLFKGNAGPDYGALAILSF